MRDDSQIDRRSVIKSAGSAIVGTAAIGAGGAATAAAADSYDGHLEINVPYTNADLDIKYTIEYDTCDAEISFDVEQGTWTEENHYDCTSRDSHAEFDAGIATGEIDVEVDFVSDTVEISAEGCANYFFGEECRSASRSHSF